jgi:hypothetical protein
MVSLAERDLTAARQHSTNATKDMQTVHTKLQMNKSNLASMKAELQSPSATFTFNDLDDFSVMRTHSFLPAYRHRKKD